MFAEVIGIGDELLYGQTVNSNAAEIAAKLIAIGIEPKYLTTVGDDEIAMRDAFDRALARVDIIITTGGLGPTPDDFTQRVIASYFGMNIEFYDDMLEDVKNKYARLKRVLPDVSRNQALFPVGATRIYNPIGTATGIQVQQSGKILFALPGVPSEAMAMMDSHIIPLLKEQPQTEYIAYQLVRTIGWGESQIQEKITPAGLEAIANCGCGLAFLPKHGMVDLRLTARGVTRVEAERKLQSATPVLISATEGIRYSTSIDTIIDVIKFKLIAQKKWLGIAESCTGGELLSQFTEVPGISEVLRGGVVSYHNSVKTSLLNVPLTTLESVGAVSKETAVAMAEGVCKSLNADFGVSITGISGPGGGSDLKPVGTVWIAVCRRELVATDYNYHSEAVQFVFPGPRQVHRIRSVNKALELLWRTLNQ